MPEPTKDPSVFCNMYGVMTRQRSDWEMDYVVKTFSPSKFPSFARFDLQSERNKPFDFVVLPKPIYHLEMEKVFIHLISHPVDEYFGSTLHDGVKKSLYLSRIPIPEDTHEIVVSAMYLMEIPRYTEH